MDFKTRKHTDNGKCYRKQLFVLLLLMQKGEDRERRIERLSLYPSGDSIRNGNGYISFYIILADPDTMPAGFEINVSFKLFVYDHFQDEYLTIQGRYIGLYPRGNQSQDGQNLSLYIFLTDCFVFPKYFMLSPSYILTLMGRYGLKVHPKERKIYAECKIRLLDQKRGDAFMRTNLKTHLYE
ncbi:hypothetical protein Peur_004895 [Populus x canadensis]